MRDDMFEVIIERPRRGSRMGHHRRTRRMDSNVDVRRDPESIPHQIGLARWTKLGNWKSLNENLAPLRRYLERQVNRPWDKVWSEISQNLSVSSTVQQHVRDHVGDFVAIRTFVHDGTIWLTGRYGQPLRLTEGHYRLYVDPRTGLLRNNKYFITWQKKRRDMRVAAEKYRAARMRVISENVQAHKLDDDCWWEIRLAAIPTKIVTYPSSVGPRQYSIRRPFTDAVLSAKLSKLPVEELYGRDGVFAGSKRQLSRREIVDLDLPR